LISRTALIGLFGILTAPRMSFFSPLEGHLRPKVLASIGLLSSGPGPRPRSLRTADCGLQCTGACQLPVLPTARCGQLQLQLQLPAPSSHSSQARVPRVRVRVRVRVACGVRRAWAWAYLYLCLRLRPSPIMAIWWRPPAAGHRPTQPQPSTKPAKQQGTRTSKRL
jgi:hypothetical protein